jgi:large subunit ribosomal protein L10
VKKATTDFKSLSNMILLSNLGVTSEQNQELRSVVREKKMKFRMVRNRLTQKAFSDLGLKDSSAIFKGPTFVLDGPDPVESAKTALELVTKYEKTIKLVGGLLEGKLLTVDEVKSLSKSKSKPELLGDVVAQMRGPGGRVAAALKGPGSRIAGAIKALVEKLEKSAVPAAAPAEAAPAAAPVEAAPAA